LIAFFLLPLLAFAQTEVKYLRNYDGDTNTFDIAKVRVLGVDTAELRSKKPCEKEFGLVAKKFVEDALKSARKITLSNHSKRDIYGRILGDVHYDGKDLKVALLENHLAVPYVPKKRQKVNWCSVQEKRNGSKKI
jgi:endonuclease YncB( thermonuclease family)